MLQIDLTSRVPIYEQIYTNIIRLASAGVLKPGDKILPVRSLAAQLGINPNTVAKAYRQLESEDTLYLMSAEEVMYLISSQGIAQKRKLLLMIFGRA